MARHLEFGLRSESEARGEASVLGGVRLCVLTSRIALNGTITEHVGPAAYARHYRYDVDGVQRGSPARRSEVAGVGVLPSTHLDQPWSLALRRRAPPS